MSGFDLLRAVATDTCPLGIVVSNCADHATRAFEEGAFDYLVMPVAAERFDRAMTRAHRHSASERHSPAGSRHRSPIWWASGSGNYIRSIPNQSTTSRRTATTSPCAPARWNTSAAIRSSVYRCSWQAWLHPHRAVPAGECRGRVICRSGRSWNICLDSNLRCLPAFERCLSRFDSAHYPAAGVVEALCGHCAVERHCFHLRNQRVRPDGRRSRPKVVPPLFRCC